MELKAAYSEIAELKQIVASKERRVNQLLSSNVARNLDSNFESSRTSASALHNKLPGLVVNVNSSS